MPTDFPGGADAYFSQQQKKRQRRQTFLMGVLIVICTYTFFLSIVLFIFRTPFFFVRSIKVEGNTYVSSEEIKSAVYGSLKKDPSSLQWFWFQNMLWWPSHIDQSKLRFTPGLTEVSIEKHYRTHEIVLKVKERTPIGIWCREQEQPGQCFWFDENGLIFERSLSAEGSLIPVIHDYSQNMTGLNQFIIPQSFISNLFSITNVLSRSGLGIREIRLNDLDLQEVEVSTYDGPRLLFSLRFPADMASTALHTLQADGSLSKLQVIDLRVQNRVYYQ